MDGFFVFDKESGMGFTVTDKDIQTAAGAIGTLVGAYVVYGLVTVIIGLLLLSPFATVFALDYLFATVVKNNLLFFVGLGVLLILTRLLWGKGSQNRVVRTLSFVYILFFSLYLLLDVLHLNVGVYTFFGLFDKYLPDSAFAQVVTLPEINAKIGDHWFYCVFHDGCDHFFNYIKWAVSQILTIDHTPYSVALADINILLVLKTVALDVAIGGFSLITVLAGAAILFAVLAVAILLPYFLAFFITITINKGIYTFRGLQARKHMTPNEEHASDPVLQAAIAKEDMKTPTAQKEAAALYLQAAKSGNSYAQVLYANCLQSGKGVAPNKEETFIWYKKAASRGICNAMYMTALNYCYGYGTYKDLTLARSWLMAALRHKEYFLFVQNNPMLKENADAIMKKSRFTKYF